MRHALGVVFGPLGGGLDLEPRAVGIGSDAGLGAEAVADFVLGGGFDFLHLPGELLDFFLGFLNGPGSVGVGIDEFGGFGQGRTLDQAAQVLTKKREK